ncbi:hypothetical protein BV898_00524 [Hypsibius exemplaris]|uniref:G-protein coupled receptors family 1 profile domain-containing protein n=1 Tax=Hypsibius exemplaris TaxID=2072580 RepID=A0A1W0XDV2_HYPEX|nr:hypothetical protein BV898_00524 [Hypsibius exemplaris]
MVSSWNSSVMPATNVTGKNATLSQADFFAMYYTNFILSMAIGSLICLFTFVSNLICLIAICVNPKLKKRGNVLVANLVVVTMLISATVQPLSIASNLYRQYHDLPRHFCDWAIYFYILTHAFVWHECFLALNRFVAIVFPYRFNIISSPKGIVITLILGYAIPICLDLSALIVKPHLYVSALPFGSCRFDPNGTNTWFPAFHSVIGVYAPICLIGAFYFAIYAAVLLRKFRLRNLPLNVRSARVAALQSKRMRLARMLFVTFVWNFITFLPSPLVTALVRDAFTNHPPLFFGVRYIALLGVAGNTIIYGFLNPDYRQGMLAVLRCTPRRVTPSFSSGGVET